jgi:hypothetical protein
MTATASTLGTPRYMSPEQIRSAKGVDARSDVWAIGTILYELLTGRTPFTGESATGVAAAIVTEDPAPLRMLRPDAPEGLEQVLAATLVKNPARRIPTAAALRHSIEQCLNPRFGAMATPAPPPVANWSPPANAMSSAQFQPLAPPPTPIPSSHGHSLHGSSSHGSGAPLVIQREPSYPEPPTEVGVALAPPSNPSGGMQAPFPMPAAAPPPTQDAWSQPPPRVAEAVAQRPKPLVFVVVGAVVVVGLIGVAALAFGSRAPEHASTSGTSDRVATASPTAQAKPPAVKTAAPAVASAKDTASAAPSETASADVASASVSAKPVVTSKPVGPAPPPPPPPPTPKDCPAANKILVGGKLVCP